MILMETSRRHSTIKVREDAYLRYGFQKVSEGLICAEVEIEAGKIGQLTIGGNFPLLQEDQCSLLSAALRGVEFDFRMVSQKVSEFLSEHRIDCPGVCADDFASAIVGERGLDVSNRPRPKGDRAP
jgi:hypothetical protein